MGVKSLWSLLTPVGRPVMLETVEGKSMAIDSSIWIYQFQATMRDKEGHALSNAHVLGFLRRISKLLFYGIKPVFVFDGGAPALKRNTITERKKKKSGAASSHAKVAEKLLAAQMRREAVNHVERTVSKGKGKAPAAPVTLDDNTVYLEDIDPRMPKSPAKKKTAETSPPKNSPSKKRQFYDHDPYRLPEVNLDDIISKVTQSAAPDPRLATEDELQAFIEDMKPEDFDVTSPAFRELPTEVQYEIIGDLRLKSRQTSYNRLQNMLKIARTPLDFSKQQILNLKQRNALTQQLLTTTDSIGKAHIEIPVRIASERNREYVLVKNEGESGGWILGIRDDGTRDKPIEIDQDNNDDQDDGGSDAAMEEVSITREPGPDQDLRRYRREMALNALANRYAPKQLAPLTSESTISKTPLFDLSDEESLVAEVNPIHVDSDDDQALAYAVQESMDSGPRAQTSVNQIPSSGSPSKSLVTPIKLSESSVKPSTSASNDAILYSNRLRTALSIAGAGPRTPDRSQTLFASTSVSLHSPEPESPGLEYVSESEVTPSTLFLPSASPPHQLRSPSPSPRLENNQVLESETDDDMEEVVPTSVQFLKTTDFGTDNPTTTIPSSVPYHDMPPPLVPIAKLHDDSSLLSTVTVSKDEASDSVGTAKLADVVAIEVHNDQSPASWSRSSSPNHEDVQSGDPPRPPSPTEDSWDATQEIDVRAEEDEYVRFMSQVQGKDLDEVRQEIDDEINALNKERKAAMRDSEDITQQMISQIMTMLRLFGIPYITAPMEAEAQCATLVSLGLVEGIITDDSDVFLFGGQRVFKNMFNQSKTVECFLLTDLARELGLGRDTLIRLAYLLGSDYVEGLPGVGPVVAMELLKEFPGEDGLHKFKDWWIKVQNGRDRPEDSQSAFRKRFKKKFKNLYLPQDWPNPAVRDAYYHPTVDESDEPFKWGLPDLDGLRMFLREELRWQQAKVDELLLPIIQRMGKRVQAAALNKQGTLNEYFDLTVGQGTYAPRKRSAYASKRLQKVVADFRKNNKSPSATSTPDPATSESSEYEDAPVKKKAKRPRKSPTDEEQTGIPKASRGRGKGGGGARGRGRGKGVVASRKRHSSESHESKQSESD